MNIAICEDEMEQQTLLENMINSLGLNIAYEIHKYASGEELVKAYYNKLHFSIILLDMQMKEMDGIKTAEIVRNYDNNCIIIIITSILEYAMEGYSINAFDFILKPVNKDKLNQILKRAIKRKQDYENRTYVIENRDKTIVLKLSSILCIESKGRKINIICENGEYSSNDNITNMENKLKDKGFVRISRYYIVNLEHIKEIGVKGVVFHNGKSLLMSKKLCEEVKIRYMGYMMEGMI